MKNPKVSIYRIFYFFLGLAVAFVLVGLRQQAHSQDYGISLYDGALVNVNGVQMEVMKVEKLIDRNHAGVVLKYR